jgi:hypothetical protein
MKYILNFIFVFSFFVTSAQTNGVAYTRDYEFKEGIYLSLDQFKQNNPIPKSLIVSGVPRDQLDFFSQVLEQKLFVYKDLGGNEIKIEVATLWGYCQNRTIYLNFNEDFNRVNVIGTLFHFTASVIVPPSYQDPMNTNYGIRSSYTELRQFVFDSQTNKVHDFNVKEMELILKEDADLYAQFTALKKRNKANSIFIYLRKYNEKHPLYLPGK